MSRRGSGARIYIGNLPESIIEEDIETLFEKYGRIRAIDIKNARSISGTTYAFLEFDDSRQAEDAVEGRNGYKFVGNRLRVEFTGDRRPKKTYNKSHGPPKRTSYRVYVTGLPPVASWQDLKDHMRKAGHVGYANIERRVGIVEYETREDMEKSIRKLDKSEFKNVFHRCQIRVRADKESVYRDTHRSYSRGNRYRYSRSRSRSRSFDRSLRRSASYSSRSYPSKHRYSNDRSYSNYNRTAYENDKRTAKYHSRARSYTHERSESHSDYTRSRSYQASREKRKYDDRSPSPHGAIYPQDNNDEYKSDEKVARSNSNHSFIETSSIPDRAPSHDGSNHS